MLLLPSFIVMPGLIALVVCIFMILSVYRFRQNLNRTRQKDYNRSCRNADRCQCVISVVCFDRFQVSVNNDRPFCPVFFARKSIVDGLPVSIKQDVETIVYNFSSVVV